MGHRIGYARVSTGSQSYEIQEEMLQAAGVTRVYHDKASGKNLARPGFEEMAARLDSGDTVVVTKLDRLGRSLRDLIGLVEDWKDAGIGLQILDQGIDTSTDMGKVFFQISGIFAEYERNKILERTQAGIAKARENGTRFGRPPEIDPDKVEAVQELSKTMTVTKACLQVGLNRSAYYRLTKED